MEIISMEILVFADISRKDLRAEDATIEAMQAMYVSLAIALTRHTAHSAGARRRGRGDGLT